MLKSVIATTGIGSQELEAMCPFCRKVTVIFNGVHDQTVRLKCHHTEDLNRYGGLFEVNFRLKTIEKRSKTEAPKC